MSLRETEKRLTAIYSKARADIGREWYKYMHEIEGKTSALYDRIREARRQGNKDLAAELTKEYQDAVKSSTILNARYRAMVQDTTAQLKSVTDTAYAYINVTLPEAYAGAYNKLGKITSGINGYTFSLVDADTVRNLAMSDKSLLPYKVVNGEKFERWNTKIINSQLMQGILQGESIPTMAKRLENATEMTRKAAIRNARTMTTSAENKGRNDSYKRADDDGIIMVKGWICAIDDRTRYEHIHADGQEVGVNEAFSVGGEKLDYPRDPKGSPQNIYNCRCTMKTRIVGFRRADGSISYVKDGDYSGVRAVKGEDGKTVFVDKWVDKSAESGIMNIGSEEMYRKKSDFKIEPMPKKQLHRIEKRFKACGGVIQYDEITDEYLKSKNAEAITYNASTILIRRNAGRASVFEELIHATQYRNGENDGTYISRLRCEILAQEKLIKHAKAYKLTDNEVTQTKQALEAYKKELEEYIKNGGV